MSFDYAVVLTGGIATGKSSVAKMFKADGFVIIDADKIAHEMLDLQHEKISELFGAKYVEDKKVQRKLLGTLIFSNREEKLRLESLLHPLIFDEIERQALKEDRKSKAYIVDIPLFFETKRYPIEKSIVVYTPHEKQLERLMKRDDSIKKEANKRIDSQLSIEEKKQLGTYIIDNSHNMKHLQEEYVKVKNKILDTFKG